MQQYVLANGTDAVCADGPVVVRNGFLDIACKQVRRRDSVPASFRFRGWENRTTVMIHNVPYDLGRNQLEHFLNKQGYEAKYDFVHLPLDFGSNKSLGYAVINFTKASDACSFRSEFDGFWGWAQRGNKSADMVWSDRQGLKENAEYFRNFVLHPAVPDRFKPAMFRDGQRVAFSDPYAAEENKWARYLKKVPALRWHLKRYREREALRVRAVQPTEQKLGSAGLLSPDPESYVSTAVVVSDWVSPTGARKLWADVDDDDEDW